MSLYDQAKESIKNGQEKLKDIVENESEKEQQEEE